MTIPGPGPGPLVCSRCLRPAAITWASMCGGCYEKVHGRAPLSADHVEQLTRERDVALARADRYRFALEEIGALASNRLLYVRLGSRAMVKIELLAAAALAEPEADTEAPPPETPP